MATITTIPVEPFTSFYLWGEEPIMGWTQDAQGRPIPPCIAGPRKFGYSIQTPPQTVTNTSLSYEQGVKFYWLLNNLTLSVTMTFHPNDEISPSKTLTALTTYRRTKVTPFLGNTSIPATYSTTPTERVCESRGLSQSGGTVDLNPFIIDGQQRLHWEAMVDRSNFGDGVGFTEEWTLIITTADIDLSYVFPPNPSVTYSDYTIPITLNIFGGLTFYVKLFGLTGQVNEAFTLDYAEIISAEICEVTPALSIPPVVPL